MSRKAMAISSPARMLTTLRARASEASLWERCRSQAAYTPMSRGTQLNTRTGAGGRIVQRAFIREPSGRRPGDPVGAGVVGLAGIPKVTAAAARVKAKSGGARPDKPRTALPVCLPRLRRRPYTTAR